MPGIRITMNKFRFDIGGIILKIYIKCSIETDTYKIEDFKNGAVISIHPKDFGSPAPAVLKTVIRADTDKLSDSIILT